MPPSGGIPAASLKARAGVASHNGPVQAFPSIGGMEDQFPNARFRVDSQIPIEIAQSSVPCARDCLSNCRTAAGCSVNPTWPNAS